MIQGPNESHNLYAGGVITNLSAGGVITNLERNLKILKLVEYKIIYDSKISLRGSRLENLIPVHKEISTQMFITIFFK